MPNVTRSLTQRVAAAALLTLALAVPAAAQQPTPNPPAAAPDPGPGFITRYDFHLGAARLLIDDQRFSWDTHFGGEIDVIDYVLGRATIAADYEAVLGDEFRVFDPNQGNYTLEVAGSARVQKAEIVGFLHHVSRHLGDRPKRFPIAWNVVGARVLGRVSAGGATFDLQADAGHLTQHSHVDYQWIANVDVLIRRPLNETVGLFAHGTGQLVGVDETILHRTRQSGGLAEFGARVNGRAGAVEVFVGFEHRIDADPLDGLSQHWVMAGFRLVNR